MLFCFAVQNFTEVGQSTASYGQKTIFIARQYADMTRDIDIP